MFLLLLAGCPHGDVAAAAAAPAAPTEDVECAAPANSAQPQRLRQPLKSNLQVILVLDPKLRPVLGGGAGKQAQQRDALGRCAADLRSAANNSMKCARPSKSYMG